MMLSDPAAPATGPDKYPAGLSWNESTADEFFFQSLVGGFDQWSRG
jgi:hypothetical protein